MNGRLKQETDRLVASWQQHDASMLRDYLVADVEDPRINIQSILTRHFLLEALFGPRFARLQVEELRFAAVLNWLLTFLNNYHWNTLSVARTKQSFLRHGFLARAIHIGTLLRWCFHCPDTHNEGAYTFILTKTKVDTPPAVRQESIPLNDGAYTFIVKRSVQ